jgi:hypothetical protein
MSDSELAVVASQTFPAPILIERAGASTRKKFFEFFTVPIRNAHTRAAYYRAIQQFLTWCERAIVSLLKAAVDFTTTVAKGAKNKSEKELAEKLRAGLADIPGKLMAVQSRCLELEEQNRKLRLQLEAEEKWETEANRWQLTELADGLFVYKVKCPIPAEDNLLACHHCFHNGKISAFQRPSQNDNHRVCPECKFEFSAVRVEPMMAFGSDHGRSFIDPTRD